MKNKKTNKTRKYKKYVYGRKKISDYIINFLSVCCACLIILFIANNFLFAKLKINIPKENIAAFQMPIKNFLKLNELSAKYNLPFDELIAIYSLENNFFPDKLNIQNENDIEKSLIINYHQIKKKYDNHVLNQYSLMFKNILSEIKYFPVPADVCPENDLPYIFGDGWDKTYNKTAPQGCNIFDRENICGRIPIVSMTNGELLELNWNDDLGYNICVKTINNNKYLYCHLDKFAEDLKKNSKINAGQLLGYMGNSKLEKKEKHKIVYLRLCIKPKTKFSGDDFFINPYLFLRFIEPSKISIMR